MGPGRKPGSKNRPKLQFVGEDVEASSLNSPRQRMAELRRRVALYIAEGMSVDEIAAVMGIDVDKLQALLARLTLKARMGWLAGRFEVYPPPKPMPRCRR